MVKRQRPSGLNLFAKESVLSRKANGTAHKDLLYYLVCLSLKLSSTPSDDLACQLGEEGSGTRPLALPTIISDAGNLIVAGTNIPATALSIIKRSLDIQDLIRQEHPCPICFII
jgi:hypothetical protein